MTMKFETVDAADIPTGSAELAPMVTATKGLAEGKALKLECGKDDHKDGKVAACKLANKVRSALLPLKPLEFRIQHAGETHLTVSKKAS